MVANSLYNVRESLASYPIIAIHGWLDSTVALYWIRRKHNEWKQFVSNRVAKIRNKDYIQWRYCPTADNPADIGSRGVNTLPARWFEGPDWLTYHESWPNNIVDSVPKEKDLERKVIKIHLLLSVNDVNHLKTMLERCCSLIKGNVKLIGELSAEEIGNALNFWIKLVQQEA